MKALSFEGNGIEYFKIWIVNVLLTIVTLGLYHPWAKVRNNRYFYGNSILEGRNFEYHATGKQLFVGYLIAMALLIAYIIVKNISPTGGLIMIGALFLAIPWLILRSMIFNMRMMSFSNVHFDFTGKIGRAYLNFFAYPLALYIGYSVLSVGVVFAVSVGGLTAVILGFILIAALVAFSVVTFAFIKKKNTEYFVDNTRYGQGGFTTDVTVKKFMMIILKTLGVSLLVMLASGVVIALGASILSGADVLVGFQNVGQNPELMAEAMSSLIPVFTLSYIVMILASIVIMAYSIARQRSYVYSNTSLDDTITFSSTLKALPFAWVLTTNFIVVILSAGFAFPWAKVRTARIMLENTLVNAENGFDDYMTQKQKETSSLGEQVGDAFDVDVGLGF